MPNTATITAKIGPGAAVTALAVTGISQFDVNCDSGVLTIVKGSVITKYDVAAATTVTVTVSSNVWALTIV